MSEIADSNPLTSCRVRVVSEIPTPTYMGMATKISLRLCLELKERKEKLNFFSSYWLVERLKERRKFKFYE